MLLARRKLPFSAITACLPLATQSMKPLGGSSPWTALARRNCSRKPRASRTAFPTKPRRTRTRSWARILPAGSSSSRSGSASPAPSPICSNDGVVSAGQNQEAVTAQDAHRQVFVKVEEQPARQLEQPLPWRRPKIIRSRRVKAVQNLVPGFAGAFRDRKSTRLNSSHGYISYAVFCLKKKKQQIQTISAILSPTSV